MSFVLSWLERANSSLLHVLAWNGFASRAVQRRLSSNTALTLSLQT